MHPHVFIKLTLRRMCKGLSIAVTSEQGLPGVRRARAALWNAVAWAGRGNLVVASESPVWQLGALGAESQNISLGSNSHWLQALLPQDIDQEVDILHCQAKCLIFAQFFVWRMSGDELSQLGKGTVDILLPPSFPGVCEDPPGHV